MYQLELGTWRSEVFWILTTVDLNLLQRETVRYNLLYMRGKLYSQNLKNQERFFFLWMVINIKTYNWTVCRGWEPTEQSLLNGMSLPNSSYRGLRIYVEEEAGKFQEPEAADDSKESVSSRHNRTEKQMNSQKGAFLDCSLLYILKNEFTDGRFR